MCPRSNRASHATSRKVEFLKTISAYFKIIRPKNLLMVALTQGIIYHYLFASVGTYTTLQGFILYLFISTTVLIAAGGYVINDIADFKADFINKPHKTYIPYPITERNGWIFYISIVIAGLLISIFIAWKTQNIPLITLYPLASMLLYFYSFKYKNSVLTGNIIVSLFIAFVSGIVMVAERHFLFHSNSQLQSEAVLNILIFFMVFSFLVNLIREIIKDIEDAEGDKTQGIMTLPIKYGFTRAKNICIILLVVTIAILLIWIISTTLLLDFRVKVYLGLLVVAPLIIIIQILTKSTQKKDFQHISSILKWTMLAGLGACILMSQTIIHD